nr:unnamed protein product [Callosobruchus chinensis]
MFGCKTSNTLMAQKVYGGCTMGCTI